MTVIRRTTLLTSLILTLFLANDSWHADALTGVFAARPYTGHRRAPSAASSALSRLVLLPGEGP
jgi:hypothetical protein